MEDQLGTEALVKRYPTGTNVVPFAAMCTMAAQDQGAARRIRPLVSSSDAPRVKVWRYVAADYFRWCDADEAASGRCKWLWGTPLNYGNVVFSSDSQSVWCTSGLGRSAAVQFDVQTGEVKRAYSGLSNQIYAVAPEPQEKWLIGVLAGPDFQGWVRWNLPGEGEEMRHPTKESCSAIALNPVKDQIAWAESKTVRTFDLETQKAGPQIELTKTVERLKFSADGKRLAISAGSISIWDAATGKRRYSLPDFSTQPRGKIACEHLVDFDDEGRVWATAFVFGAKPPQRPLLRFAADGKKWDTVVPNLNGLPASAVLSADRRCLAIAENNEGPGGAESIQIWDLQTQQLQMRLPGHHNHIASLCFSPDGKHLASAGRLGGPIKIWSLEAKAKRETGPAKKGAPL